MTKTSSLGHKRVHLGLKRTNWSSKGLTMSQNLKESSGWLELKKVQKGLTGAQKSTKELSGFQKDSLLLTGAQKGSL